MMTAMLLLHSINFFSILCILNSVPPKINLLPVQCWMRMHRQHLVFDGTGCSRCSTTHSCDQSSRHQCLVSQLTMAPASSCLVQVWMNWHQIRGHLTQHTMGSSSITSHKTCSQCSDKVSSKVQFLISFHQMTKPLQLYPVERFWKKKSSEFNSISWIR